MNRMPNWPDGKKMAFAIRDDDLSYFSSCNMLDRLYGNAWERGFKVSFSSI